MRLPFATAIDPFTGVFLLSRPDMIIMDMINQIIHVTQIAHFAAIPSTCRDLVPSKTAVVIVLTTADQCDETRGVGDFAVGVG